MKIPRLIIHPKDHSTDFLSAIHKKLKHKTILTGGVDQATIMDMMQNYNRLIIMGHGSEDGLLSINQFPIDSIYIIDELAVDVLRSKKNNIFIWCYASDFAKQNRIPAFCTGMFISEKREAITYGLAEATEQMIEDSNRVFVEEMSKVIDQNISQIYEYILSGPYVRLAKSNPVARYNLKRIELIL